MEIHFDLSEKQKQIDDLQQQQLEDDFWNDHVTAQKQVQKLTSLKAVVDGYKTVNKAHQDLAEEYNLVKEEDDEELKTILDIDVQNFLDAMGKFEMQILLSHEYDQANCILEIHPGAGGTEACDWADMLYRMYSRYAARKKFKITVLDYLAGDEAGIKSITIKVEGALAYGHLKCEKGIHRLVRISPFDSGARRHTSFASVEVMPEFDDSIAIALEEKDLEIDTMRSSGAGGQHVNKTDSAVRITHIPTGISVKCQNGRSQHDNKEQALLVLKSKLYQVKIEEQMKKMADLKGEQKANEWGSQIRSYVFHPYSLVKDVRSGYETSQVQDVMDGALDEFVYAYLQSIVE